MRTDYEQHLSECAHCRRRQNVARTIDVLLLSVSTLSIVAFLLAAVVIHRVELITHIGTFHCCTSHQTHVVAISLEAVAVAGIVFSTLLWVLVAIATPLPGFLGGLVQQRIPSGAPQQSPRPLHQARRLEAPALTSIILAPINPANRRRQSIQA